MMAGQPEQAIHFDAGGVLLEGRLELTEIPRAAVITHPLYGGINRISGLAQVIVGGNDDIAPSKAVADQLGVWAPDADFQIIEAADHFFWHQMDRITEALLRHIP